MLRESIQTPLEEKREERGKSVPSVRQKQEERERKEERENERKEDSGPEDLCAACYGLWIFFIP